MMNRRGFTKLIAAAVLGVRVADKLLPAARSWSMSHYVNPAGAVPWPPSPITDELLADGLRVHPLIAIGRRHA